MTPSRDTLRRAEYARGYLALEMYPHARAELAGIARVEQRLPAVWTWRVDDHLARRQWRRTVAVAGALARAHPEVEQGWIGWAFALRELGRVSEAHAVLVRAERHHGATSAVLHYNLACYLALLGELPGARLRLATAVDMDKQFEAAAREDPDLTALREADGWA